MIQCASVSEKIVITLAVTTAVAASCCLATAPRDRIRSSASPGLTVVAPIAERDDAVQEDKGENGDLVSARESVAVNKPSRLARGTRTPSDEALARGDAAFEAERCGDALREYSEAARLAPSDPAPLVGTVRATFCEADTPTAHAADPRNPVIRGGVATLRVALKIDPSYGPANLELGRALLVLDEAGEALLALRKAVSALPRDAEAHSALGVALLATGKVHESVECFRQSVALDPSSVERQTNLATALSMDGLVAEAAHVLELVVMREPQNATVNSNLGIAYLGMNQPSKALPRLRRAVELEPDRATFRSNLGYALELSGDKRGAEDQYRRAISLDPGLGSAWVNLGVLLAHLNRRQEARKAFERAIEIDPTDPSARANLQELDDLK